MTQRKWRGEGLVELSELLGTDGIDRALREMAHAIGRRTAHPENLVLLGIRTGGVHLAGRLATLLGEVAAGRPMLGALDITLYRDDVFVGLPRPEVGATEIPCSLEKRTVVLVDDVLFTGRTIRAALEELVEFGRPERVELAVLVDRGHRELPIQADHTGLRVDTKREQSVRVMLRELGHPDRVVLFGRGSA